MNVLLIIVGIAGLWYGTRLAIRGAISAADHLGMSEFVVGVAILSVGSDMPELAIAIDASIQNMLGQDSSGVVVGTAIGSGLGQIGFVLGLVGLFGYVTIPKRVVYQHGSVMLGSLLLLAIAGLDGVITRTEGASLATVYLIYFGYLLTDKRTGRAVEHSDSLMSGARTTVYIVAGLALVVLSSDITVGAAVALAESLHVRQSLVSIILIGLGSSLPELSVSLVAVLKNKPQLSVGNIIGSNIFDTLVPIGVGATIATLNFDRTHLLIDIPVLAVLSFLVLFFFVRVRGLQKSEASVILGFYLAYVVFKVAAEI